MATCTCIYSTAEGEDGRLVRVIRVYDPRCNNTYHAKMQPDPNPNYGETQK